MNFGFGTRKPHIKLCDFYKKNGTSAKLHFKTLFNRQGTSREKRRKKTEVSCVNKERSVDEKSPSQTKALILIWFWLQLVVVTVTKGRGRGRCGISCAPARPRRIGWWTTECTIRSLLLPSLLSTDWAYCRRSVTISHRIRLFSSRSTGLPRRECISLSANVDSSQYPVYSLSV